MSTSSSSFADLCQYPVARPVTASAVLRARIDLAILVGGSILAGGFFLPLIAPSHDTVAHMFWIQLLLSREDLSFPLDVAVFGLLGMVMPYAIGLLLAGSAVARLLTWPRWAAVFGTCMHGLLLFMGIGVVWVLPCLYLEESVDESKTGLCVSGVALAVTMLWGGHLMRKGRLPLNLKPALWLSFACLIWFSFLLLSVAVAYGVHIGAAASSFLVATNLVDSWASSGVDGGSGFVVRSAGRAGEGALTACSTNRLGDPIRQAAE